MKNSEQKNIIKSEIEKQKAKGKQNFNEFKKFAFKGNIIDLSIGVIIGTAFAKIVTSFSNDIIVPLIASVTNNLNFSQLFITFDGIKYETLELAKASGTPILYYGNFISTVTDFFITAICIFIAVKQLQKFSFKKHNEIEEKQAETTKECPYCKTSIHIDATRCPNCTTNLE